MGCETDLEFALLLAKLKRENLVQSDEWDITITRDTFSGEIYFMPVIPEVFNTVEVEYDPSTNKVSGRFKTFSEVQEGYDNYELDYIEVKDTQRILLLFLIENKRYISYLQPREKDMLLDKVRQIIWL